MHSWNCLPSHHGKSSRFIESGSWIPPPFFSGKNLFFFGIKSLIPYRRLILSYQGLIFLEVRDLRIRKVVNKYLLRVSRLYPFVHNKLAMCGKTIGWGTWNFRRVALRLASRRTPQLSQTGLRISCLGSAYQFYYDRWAWTASHRGLGRPWTKRAGP